MARRKGDERPDDTSPAPSELGELHCCSVADVRLSPASDRIAAHSADSGLCQLRTSGEPPLTTTVEPSNHPACVTPHAPTHPFSVHVGSSSWGADISLELAASEISGAKRHVLPFA